MTQARGLTAADAANTAIINVEAANVDITNRDASNENADTARGILQRALKALEQGKLIDKVVLPDLNRALELDEGLAAEVYFWRGVCYERMVQAATSSNVCTLYIPKKIKNKASIHGLLQQSIVSFYNAACLNPQRVLDRFNTIEQADNLFAILCCGFAYYYLGKLKPNAEQAFHRVLQSEEILGKMEQYPLAKAHALQLLYHCASSYVYSYIAPVSDVAIQQKDPAASVLFLIQQACILFYLGELGDAQERLKWAGRILPGAVYHNADYDACWGLLELSAFNTKKGKKYLERAYKQNPQNFMANAGLAYLAYLRNDKAKAAEYMQVVFKFFPHAKGSIEWIDFIDIAAESNQIIRKKLLLSQLSSRAGDIKKLSLFSRFLLLQVLVEPESIFHLQLVDVKNAWLREEMTMLLRQEYEYDGEPVRIAKLNIFLLSLCASKASIPSIVFADPTSIERRVLLEHWEQGIADKTPADVYPHVLDALKEEARVNPLFLLSLSQMYAPIKRFLMDVYTANGVAVAIPAIPLQPVPVATALPASSSFGWWEGVSRLFSARGHIEPDTAADRIIGNALACWRKNQLGDLEELAKLYELDFANVTAVITKAMQTIREDEPAVMSMLFFYQGMVLALAKRRFEEAYSAFMMVEAYDSALCKRHHYYPLFKAYVALGRADLAVDKEQPIHWKMKADLYWDMMADQFQAFKVHALDAMEKHLFGELWRGISQNEPLQKYLNANRDASFRTLQRMIVQSIYADAEEKDGSIKMAISQFLLRTYFMASGSFEKVTGKVNSPRFFVYRFLSYLAVHTVSNPARVEAAFVAALEQVAPPDFAILLLEQLDKLPEHAVSGLSSYCKRIPGFENFVAKRDELFFSNVPPKINDAGVAILNSILLLNDKHVGAYVYRYMLRLYQMPRLNEPTADLQTALALSTKETVAKFLMEIQKLCVANRFLSIQRAEEVEPGANDLAFQIGTEFLQAKNYTAARSFYTAIVPTSQYAARIGFCLAIAKYLQAKELANGAAGKRAYHLDKLRHLPESKLIADLMACLKRVAAYHPEQYKDMLLRRTTETRAFLASLLENNLPSVDAALLVFAAKVHEHTQSTEEIESCYQAALQTDPNSAVALDAYCSWLFKSKQGDKLEKLVHEVLARAKEIEEGNRLSVVEIAYEWLGVCHATYYQFTVNVVDVTAENAKIFLCRGEAYCFTKKWEQALHYIKQATKLDPTLEERASLVEAIAYYQIHGQHRSLSEDVFLDICTKFIVAAQIYPWRLGKFLERTSFPNVMLGMMVNGYVSLHKGHAEQAAAFFDKAISHYDEDNEGCTFFTFLAYCGLYAVLNDVGRTDENIEAMRAAISESSTLFGPGKYTKYLYCRMAMALMAHGEWREASVYISKDEHYPAYGSYYLRQEKFEQARVFIEAVPEPALSRVFLFLHMGDKEKALQMLDLYMQRYASDVRARLLRGQLLCEPGNHQNFGRAAEDFAVILRSETYAHPRYLLAAQTERYLHYKELPCVSDAKPVFVEADAEHSLLVCIEKYREACSTNADGLAILMIAYAAIGQYIMAREYAMQLLRKYDFYCLHLQFRPAVLKLLAEPWCNLEITDKWRYPLGVVSKETPTPAAPAVASTLASPERGMNFLPWSKPLGFVLPATGATKQNNDNETELDPSNAETAHNEL